MRRHRLAVVASLLVLFASSFTYAAGQQEAERSSRGHESIEPACQPGIEKAVRVNFEYLYLYSVLAPHQKTVMSLLSAVADAATYQALLDKAAAVAANVPSGRVLITLPDGTVVVDTAAMDDPTNSMAQGNSYEHFVAKTVNENHNTPIAILSTQLYPCGFGLERKLSTTTGATESYFAVRLGDYLDSVGTLRLSTAR